MHKVNKITSLSMGAFFWGCLVAGLAVYLYEGHEIRKIVEEIRHVNPLTADEIACVVREELAAYDSKESQFAIEKRGFYRKHGIDMFEALGLMVRRNELQRCSFSVE